MTDFLLMQIDAGVDAVQIFDSLGGAAGGNAFEARVWALDAADIQALKGRVPVIVFARGAHGNWARAGGVRGAGAGSGLDRLA